MSTCSEFELIFVTDEVDDDQADELTTAVDAFIGGHGGVTLVTITAAGESAIKAAHTAVQVLREYGIRPVRLYDDLVTRNQIAQRIGKTGQAVGYWTRGERKHGFPMPYILEAGGLWRWQEVNEWLSAHDDQYAGYSDGLSYPTAAEVDEINAWLRFDASTWTPLGVLDAAEVPAVPRVPHPHSSFHVDSAFHVDVRFAPIATVQVVVAAAPPGVDPSPGNRARRLGLASK